MYDIVIVGGGTAGLTAAIYGLRAGKKVLLIESAIFGGQITLSPNIENYPGIVNMSGNEFATVLVKQVEALHAEMEYKMVTSIQKEGLHKVVLTENEKYLCKAVILATGVTSRHLGIGREDALVGAGVSYCAVCDGAFFKGSDVAVVGGGSTALQDALLLSEYCNHVYLIHRRDGFRGEQQLVKLLQEKVNVSFELNVVVNQLVGKEAVEAIVIRDVETQKLTQLNVEGVFVAVGQKPNNDQFSELVKLNEYGYILASEDCMTSVPGVFAAGDCRTKEVRQLTTAAADGAVAALAACKYIDTML